MPSRMGPAWVEYGGRGEHKKVSIRPRRRGDAERGGRSTAPSARRARSLRRVGPSGDRENAPELGRVDPGRDVLAVPVLPAAAEVEQDALRRQPEPEGPSSRRRAGSTRTSPRPRPSRRRGAAGRPRPRRPTTRAARGRRRTRARRRAGSPAARGSAARTRGTRRRAGRARHGSAGAGGTRRQADTITAFLGHLRNAAR